MSKKVRDQENCAHIWVSNSGRGGEREEGQAAMSEMKYVEIMWAEMSPDVYGGEKCDEVRPRWKADEDGSKGDTDWREVLELAADTFPAGTKIVISVPECPECQQEVELCDCGFDWDGWVQDRYS